jgi:hypothetical protein
MCVCVCVCVGDLLHQIIPSGIRPEVGTDFLNGHTSACRMLYSFAVCRFFKLAFSSLCDCIVREVKSGSTASIAPATPLYGSARAGLLAWTAGVAAALWHSGSAHRQQPWCQICRSRPAPVHYSSFHGDLPD